MTNVPASPEDRKPSPPGTGRRNLLLRLLRAPFPWDVGEVMAVGLLAMIAAWAGFTGADALLGFFALGVLVVVPWFALVFAAIVLGASAVDAKRPSKPAPRGHVAAVFAFLVLVDVAARLFRRLAFPSACGF